MTTAKKINVWSPTKLHDFEECPYRAWLKHVERVPDPRPNPYADRGTAIHALCEKYLRGEIDPVPDELKHFSDELKSLRKYGKKLMLEEEWGFDRDWQPCDYRGKDVWGRMKLDIAVELKPTVGLIVDLKTGKKLGNEIKHSQQGQQYALGCFIRHPDWQFLTVEFWYADKDDMLTFEVTRKDALERYLKTFDHRLRKVTDSEQYLPKPSIVACKWCPYGDTGHCDKRVVDQKATGNFYKRKFGGTK